MSNSEELAKQLAHDVLNALSVLHAKQEQILNHDNIDEIYQIVSSSISKIQSLAALCKAKIKGPVKNSFNIKNLLEDSLAEIQNDYALPFINIISHYELILNVDATEFLNAVTNIIKNSAEADSRKMTITIEAHGIYFTDDGSGMTEDSLHKVKYFQSTKKDGHGIGLLSIAHFCRNNGLVMKFKNNNSKDIYPSGFCVYFSLIRS